MEALRVRLDSFSIEGNGEARRVGAAIQAWNTFRHFYPYSKEVAIDWNRVLRQALRQTLQDQSPEEFRATLRQMLVALKDGHANVGRPVSEKWPVRFDWAEGKVVVADTARWGWVEGTPCARPGDVLLGVGDTSAERLFRKAKANVSGSSQHKRETALSEILRHAGEEPLTLRLKRKWKRFECEVESRIGYAEGTIEPRPDPIQILADSIGYMDLTRAEWEKVVRRASTLKKRSGLIIDMRGYPKGKNGLFLEYLWPGSEPLRIISMQTPEVAYPDQDSLSYGRPESNPGGWFEPRETTIQMPTVVLTDGRAISAAESFVGTLKYSDLATVVGGRTAGATGIVNRTELVGGQVLTWTGQKTAKPDGSQFHMVGVRPDIRASRTIQGIRNGQDEVLRTAIRVLSDSLSTR